MKKRNWRITLIGVIGIVFVACVLLLPQASAQEKETLEERVAMLEAKVEEIEQRLLKLEGLVEKEEPKRVEVAESPISVTLVSKSFREADFVAGRFDDQIIFSFDFTNHLKKDIRAFVGIIVFKDLFEREIIRVSLTIEESIKAGDTIRWQGVIEYDPFRDAHRRLREIDTENLLVEFILEQVIYTDGTREIFE